MAPDDYVQGALNFGLVEVVYEWARGTEFSIICMMTDVSEGTIVRTIGAAPRGGRGGGGSGPRRLIFPSRLLPPRYPVSNTWSL